MTSLETRYGIINLEAIAVGLPVSSIIFAIVFNGIAPSLGIDVLTGTDVLIFIIVHGIWFWPLYIIELFNRLNKQSNEERQ